MDENDHSACVDAWQERVAKGLPAARLLQVFEQGFAAVWQRAHETLGDVTLTAILDRVLHTAAENFPFLSALKIDTVTERGYSPLADEILMLRYAQVAGELRPTLSVVKTRGSTHDRSTYFISIGKGGIRLEERVNAGRGAAKKDHQVRKAAKS